MNATELIQWAKASQPDWSQLGLTVLPKPPRRRKQGPHSGGVPARLLAMLPLQPGTTYPALEERLQASYDSVRKAVSTLRQRGHKIEVAR